MSGSAFRIVSGTSWGLALGVLMVYSGQQLFLEISSILAKGVAAQFMLVVSEMIFSLGGLMLFGLVLGISWSAIAHVMRGHDKSSPILHWSTAVALIVALGALGALFLWPPQILSTIIVQ
jgi:hypothetical protein